MNKVVFDNNNACLNPCMNLTVYTDTTPTQDKAVTYLE